jgi:ribosome-associated protein
MEKIQQIIRSAAAAADEKKASRIEVMDMRGLSSVADIFFICGAANERQVGAIVRNIEKYLTEFDLSPSRIEGLPEARWVVMDYGDILIHVFLEEVRSFYSLETLWGDAPVIFPPAE